MSMDEKEVIALRQVLIGLTRTLAELKAAETAVLHIFADLAPHVGPEVAAILGKYWDYKEEERMHALLELEKKSPGFAAALDDVPDSEPPEPPQP
jgi:hypothetical protein